MLKKYQKALVIIAAFILIAAASGQAAPCYGTHMPKKKKWFCGIEYNFLMERKLQNSLGRIKNPDQFLMISYGLFDWLSIDLKGGAGKITYKDSEYGDQDLSTSFAGAYGFRLRLWETEDEAAKIVAGFQHISVHPKRVQTTAGRYTAVADEWQGSCLASVRIKQFQPYLGFKYATYDLIRWIDAANRKRYKSLDSWGLVLGSDFWINKNLKLNLEYHFFDEKAASISLGFDF
jgi:opacity protein-like surface antigen